jgi:hypothetical protein
MKHTPCVIPVLLALTAACAPAPATTPQATVALATPSTTAASTSVPSPTATGIPRIAPLHVEGSKFVEVGGNEVVLRGAVANHFFYDIPYVYRSFKRGIDILKNMGANFVSVHWNSGFTDNRDYVESLISGLEYAKSKGFRVELALNVRGKKPNSQQPQQIQIVNDLIVNDWDALFADPVITKRIADSVDIFNPLAEPINNSGGSKIDWNEWKGIGQRAVLHIREKIGKPEAIGAISGVFWAADIRDAINNPPDIPNVGVEWHPYDGTMGNRGIGFMTQANAMIGENKLFFVGEMGFDEPSNAIEDKLKFLTSHGNSFAVWAVSGGFQSAANENHFIITARGKTVRGELVERYFKAGK